MSKRSEGLFPIVFLTVVVCISVVALTLTDEVTREKIEIARRDMILEMLSSLFPKMDDFNYSEESENYEILAAADLIGLAFMTEGSGYGGPIEILVGLENSGSIRGIQIISQKETPGLGAKIADESFLKQFRGLTVAEAALSREGGDVDAITGATISSSAVVDTVRQAISDKLDTLRDKNGEG